tara:strand:- start:12179 stop:12688 length:510 start_codon:yes stop_codon:yes gene_type:complete
MMQTVIDIETTIRDGSPSPYIPENYMVSVGIGGEMTEHYLCFKHSQQEATPQAKTILQAVLEETTLLIGHNIKFDLSWILECGFTYDGDIYDTMIYEYLKGGGVRNTKLNLSACCERRGLPIKQDVTSQFLSQGTGFEDMPWDVVEDYGKNDVSITWKLYKAQQLELGK